MPYLLSSITIRTSNSAKGMEQIEEIWKDVTSGKLPILFDSEHIFQQGISPISRYSNYESDENGNYDLSIIGVKADFFKKLEIEVNKGNYKKYNFSGNDIDSCTKEAWRTVWKEQNNKIIKRAYTIDYESTVPSEYGKDGKAHCYLYISINQ